MIREAAYKLLDERKVDLVIGFEHGLPLRSTPCFVRSRDEVNRLSWGAFCENNLARYLRKRPERVGIIAKGCDVRSLVGLIKENQISREQVVIIGVPCQGMIDRKRVEMELDGQEILEAEEADGWIILRGDGFEKTINKGEFLHQSCKVCNRRNPVIYDILIGEMVEEEERVEGYPEVAQFEAKPAQERWQYLSNAVSRCIRCYACREACPFCYCEECFVDSSQPQWIGKTTNVSDTMIFHIVRALHVAGRCVDCGACERACPMVVDIRKLTKKLERDVKELYGYEAGISLEELPPLATFKPDDPQGFMLNP